MAKFNVLVFDDHARVHETALRELAPELYPNLSIITADTFERAKQLAATRFIHLHFVDLMINGQQLGTQYIRHVGTMNPESEFVIVSSWRKERSSEVIELLGSGSKIVGFSNKLESAPLFTPFVEPRYRDWEAQSVECSGVRGPNGVVEALLAKRERINRELDKATVLPHHRLASHEDLVAEEVEHLVQRIFGVSAPAPGLTPRVDLKVLRKGFSSSVVVEALPLIPIEGLGELVPGNRCILKFSPARGTELEVRRYDHVVRFGVSLEFRVELLGYAIANSLGAVCYSFAGSTGGGELDSLDEMLLRGGDEWRSVLHDIFEPGTSNWYDVKGTSRSLSQFFTEEYDGSLVTCVEALQAWLNELRESLDSVDLRDFDRAGSEAREAWRLGLGRGMSLLLPRMQFLGSSHLQDSTAGCLVHGDLHAGNVLIGHSQGKVRFRIIDYGNAGLGPRLLDFAALELSVRLAHAAQSFGDHLELTIENLEAVYGASCRDELALVQGGATGRTTWLSVAKALEGHIPNIFEDFTPEEWLWTLFAQCLSMFRFAEIPWHKKFRLAIWLSALTEELYPLLRHELGGSSA